MLNITTRISLSKRAKKQIIKLKNKNAGSFNENSWTSISANVKNEISKRLLLAHSPRCVYCERYFISTGNQIDHFAHKAAYPQFSFSSLNLFNSCTYCNSSSRKGQKPTVIDPPNNRYDQCIFSIVHPFLNDPDVEIVFKDADKVDYDWTGCSQKGKDTILLFGWDDTMMTMFRARVLIEERLKPLTSLEEINLIQEIISYKKKA